MFKEALASGYLLQFLDAFCDIGEHGDEVIIAQEDLTFYVVPDGWNTDSILDEFLIVSLRGAPCITKLQKQPLCTQAICEKAWGSGLYSCCFFESCLVRIRLTVE